MNKTKYIVYFFLLMLLASCAQVFRNKYDTQESKLVVDDYPYFTDSTISYDYSYCLRYEPRVLMKGTKRNGKIELTTKIKFDDSTLFEIDTTNNSTIVFDSVFVELMKYSGEACESLSVFDWNSYSINYSNGIETRGFSYFPCRNKNMKRDILKNDVVRELSIVEWSKVDSIVQFELEKRIKEERNNNVE